ncbi:MAG: FUSC family protein [Actinomycetales bacterium]|nr:FUSC family protein [Actinomycetales bacterium]
MGRTPSPVVRRMAKALAVLAVVVVLPAVVAGAVFGAGAEQGLVLGLLGGLLATTAAGPRAASAVAPVLVLGGVGVSAAAGTWAWVAVLGVLGVVVGALAARAAGSPLLEVGVVLCVVPAAESPVRLAVGLALGYALGVVAGAATGAGAQRLRMRDADARLVVALGALGGLAVGGGAAIGFAAGWDHAGWLPLTVLLIGQARLADLDRGRARIRARLLGTLVGLVVLVPVVVLVLPQAWHVAATIVLLGMALSEVRTHYWLSLAAGTAAVVLVGSGPVEETSGERLAAVVIAALVVGVASALIGWGARLRAAG